MNATLNKVIILMSLFCLMLGYQNFGQLKAEDIFDHSQIQFKPLKEGISADANSCHLKPLISKGAVDSTTWLKADWGGLGCAKPGFVGWSVYDSEGGFVTSLENGLMLGHTFASPGKYTVILSYNGMNGSGKILMKSPEVLEQENFIIEIQ